MTRRLVELGGPWRLRRVGEDTWTAAQVPGCVHTDLLAAARIPDPLTEMHELGLLWIDEADWEYERSFEVDADFCRRSAQWLVCDGLDTIAEIHVNDRPLAQTRNMFRRYWFDVRKHLRPGTNRIRVTFRSPTEYGRRRSETLPYELPGTEYEWSDGRKRKVYRPWVRKAQYQFGWDWGPCLATAGIWRGLRLIGTDAPVIEYVTTAQTHVTDSVRVTVRAHLRVPAASSGVLRVQLGEHIATTEAQVQPGQAVISTTVDVTSPRLWWPVGLGAAHLYPLDVTWRGADGAECDRYETRLGLRRIELLRAADRIGESFTLRINGIDVFCKGANWIPADPFPTRVTTERYECLIDSAIDASMNMLRVWGGGIYESETFYRLCDERGLMIWQDFMFACAAYPTDDEFLDEVCAEVRHQLRELGNHACIVLWCGDNENEWMNKELWGLRPDSPPLREGWERLIQETVAPIVAEEDPPRPWWPSSPSNGGDGSPPDLRRGDQHFWEVWHGGMPFERYQEVLPRFCSEFGFQSFPSPATLRAAIAGDISDINSPVMQHHQRHGRGNQIIDQTLARYFGTPADVADRCYLSQLAHGLALKMAVEHWRRGKPTCMGALYWQLDDCWVVASWASVDYTLRYKAAHYMARRFFAPLLGSIADDGEKLDVWLTSDVPEAIDATVMLRAWHVDGQVLHEVEQQTTLAAQESRSTMSLPRATFVTGNVQAADVVVQLCVRAGDWRHDNVHALVPFKDVNLAPPALNAVATGCHVQVTTDRPALFVELDSGDIAGTFSDNVFAAFPGEPVEVAFRPRTGGDSERLAPALKVRSYVPSGE